MRGSSQKDGGVRRPGSFIALSVALAACGGGFIEGPFAPIPPLGTEASQDFGESTPEAQGVDANALAELADWVAHDDAPIYSVLISRNGKLVFELYTSGLGRDEAHYVMSATKSVTSALVGIAIDAGLLPPPDTSIANALPPSLFRSDDDRARFANVSLKDVLAMSALDAQVPPHLINGETRARMKSFLRATNRAEFAVTQAVLPQPGVSYQYTDVTPLLASGALSYATKESAFDFAETRLFGPLGFKNAEWMGQDAAGIDNGAYGLRLRPIDMQKFGILFMNGGTWNGAELVSHAWVDTSFTPWISSKGADKAPNYGWYWWQFHYGPYVAHVADGWKGQRIAIVPAEKLVVTMTACIEHGEDDVFAHVMRLVRAAVRETPLPVAPKADARLRVALDQARHVERVSADVEPRMVPTIAPKETHHSFGR